MLIRFRCWQGMFFVALVVAANNASAQAHAGVAPFLTDDVAAVAALDLGRVDLPALVGELQAKKLLPDEAASDAAQAAAALQAQVVAWRQRGATRVYVLLRFSDLAAGGPMWVVETADAAQAKALAPQLAPITERPDMRGDFDDMLPRTVRPHGRYVLGGPSEERLDYLIGRLADAPRAEAVEALAGVADADAALVVFGDADSRRVIREMFPKLPAPFEEIDGKLLADGVKSIAVTVKLLPELRVRLAVETSGDQPAATLRQSAEKGIAILKGLAMAAAMNPPADLPVSGPQLVQMIDMLTPQVEGARLSITLGVDAEELAIIQQWVGQPFHEAREAAQRNQRMNQFKRIALGMLNHESAKRSYPAAASYDADGQPLLSWRVHVLPYMEQMELYKQFKLDEPWDSEHNRKLIERMPDVYADPDPAVRKALKGAGYTTFVVPVGEGLIFGGPEGMKIRDVTDGTSNTILAVEVVPERAVIWTKPDDWQVDMSDPHQGVKRSDRHGFIGVYCDGHVYYHQNATDPTTFKALLTPAGGEVIDPY